MARLPHGTGFVIRNSRNPEGPALVFTHDEITAFVDGVRDGDFDDLVARNDLAARPCEMDVPVNRISGDHAMLTSRAVEGNTSAS